MPTSLNFAALIALSVALTWRLFLSPWPSYWDHVPPPNGWGASPVGWVDDLLGSVVWVNGTYWLYPFWLLSHAWVAKGLLIMPAFLGPIGFFAFARRLGLTPVPAAIGAMYYIVNPAVHTRYLQGHTGDLLGLALAPIVALAVWSLLESPRDGRLHKIAVAGTAIFLAASLKPHWWVLEVTTILPFVLLLFVATHRCLLDRGAASALVASLALSLVLNLPVTVISLSTGPEILQRLHSIVHLTFLSSNVRLSGAVRLAGEPGSGLLSRFGYYETGLRGLLGFVPAAIILFTSVTAPPSRRLVHIVVVASWAFVILLSTGTTYAVRPYAWLYEHAPFFTAFRESSKFLEPGTFIAATALSLGLDHLRNRGGRILPAMVQGLLVVAVAGYAWPMLSGDMRISSTQIHRPSADASNVGDWLNRQPGEFRVMMIPYDDDAFHIWPLISRRPVFGLDNDRMMSSLSGQYFAFRVAQLGRSGQGALFAAALARAGVQFIVVKVGADASSFEFTSRAATMASRAGEWLLDESRLFRRVHTTTGYAVYENLRFRGWVWMECASTASLCRMPVDCSLDAPAAVPGTVVIRDLGEWVHPSEVDATVDNRWIAGPVYEWLHPGPYAHGEMTRSQWYALTTGAARLARRIRVLRAGSYVVTVRGLLGNGAVDPEILANGLELPATTAWPHNRFGEIQYRVVHLDGGDVQIAVQAHGNLTAIDTIALSAADSASMALGSHSSSSVDRLEATTAAVSYSRPFGGLYVIRRDGTRAGMLSFSESSQPGWMMVGRGVRGRIVSCHDALLHVWTTEGSGMVLAWNGLAIGVTVAWMLSAAAFLVMLSSLAREVWRGRPSSRRGRERAGDASGG